MNFEQVWNNFKVGARNVGSFILRHLPTLLKGSKFISKFFERSSNPMISGIAQVTTKVIEAGERAYEKYATGADILDIAKEAVGVGGEPSSSAPVGDPSDTIGAPMKTAVIPDYSGYAWSGGVARQAVF